jgi:hypothetical protein
MLLLPYLAWLFDVCCASKKEEERNVRVRKRLIKSAAVAALFPLVGAAAGNQAGGQKGRKLCY